MHPCELEGHHPSMLGTAVDRAGDAICEKRHLVCYRLQDLIQLVLQQCNGSVFVL